MIGPAAIVPPHLRAPTTVDNDTIPRTRTYDDPLFGTKRAHTP